MEDKLVKGARIATIGLFLTKVLGILYVLPMNKLLSTDAMALYGISFLIYAYFTQVALAGFPVGISKLVAKYRSQGNFSRVETLYTHTYYFVTILSFIVFIILFFETNVIIELSNLDAVFNKNELNITLKILSLVLLILPSLSIIRGYIQGFEDMMPTSKSIIIEQIVRVIIIILAITVIKNMYSNGDVVAIYVASAGSLIGAIVSLIVILPDFKKYRERSRSMEKNNDEKITFATNIKAVALVSVPFIILSTYFSTFDFINTFSFAQVFDFFGFSEKSDFGKTVVSVYTIHIQKLMLIVLTISSGFTMSLIPSISALNASNNKSELKNKVTSLLLLTFFITGFLSLFVAIFNYETYYVFFGYYKIGGPVLTVSIIAILFYAIYNVLAATLLTLDKNWEVFYSFVFGAVAKISFTIILVPIFKALHLNSSLIFAFSSLVGFLLSLIFLIYRSIKLNIIDTKKFTHILKLITISLLFTFILLVVLKIVLPSINSSSSGFLRYFTNIIILLISGLISLLVYLFIANKLRYLNYISGTSLSIMIRKVLNAFR